MDWKDINFELKDHGNGLTLKGGVFCGCVLFIKPQGISRAVGIGNKFEFDLDIGGKLKVFRGATASSKLHFSYEEVSKATLNGVTFRLWRSKHGEQLVITSGGYNLLLIDKSGLYRFSGINGKAVGLPVDDAGRLRVLRT